MLSDVIEYLACPACRSGISLTDGAVQCASGHAFDVARQGYVNLLTGARTSGTADTPQMVDARDRFLASGHFQPLAGALRDRVRTAAAGPIVDAGAGTGHYLAHVLGDTERPGIALDISKPAVRKAARAHPRIGAAVADIWARLPLHDGVAGVVLNVFAPRNGPEFQRVLRPDGTLIVVTPAPGHLSELVKPLGLLTVDARKDERLAEALGGHFRLTDAEELELDLRLTHAEVATVVAMGPSAWHLDMSELNDRLAGLPEWVPVTAAFRITAYGCG